MILSAHHPGKLLRHLHSLIVLTLIDLAAVEHLLHLLTGVTPEHLLKLLKALHQAVLPLHHVEKRIHSVFSPFIASICVCIAEILSEIARISLLVANTDKLSSVSADGCTGLFLPFSRMV